MANQKTQQADNAVQHAHNAVSQAMEHPTDQLIEQADNSIRHARAAVTQAYETGDTLSASRAAGALEEECERLGD
ncbi:hypothetical protein [Paenibacillus mucilaginosus]|uniref:Uncharacterized protein n=2 Tax=Paenibacillus mucilaginosus TaxID=61624 RepID=H6NA87_9BACL|nr:hypothetical protein [Paenibacillus mucilaginosus]AEI40724.1 hypothetical protein KNP414_02163 [Paenibacillus mucilaginosus KNP414]AFC29333.1 hypothetical protein PM3016_2445 [Paenibacillus mucilaginosus 3016]MCG7211793.1 hypothetical protein [Paenibacillus mucilaginosus]WDM29856.1 hypothetical protein KCX80_12220 [Paenibacillus mucilaginosus]WFA18051.1 hypothetical protein ERY13_12590 [Paenibacillus mucilaginosus]